MFCSSIIILEVTITLEMIIQEKIAPVNCRMILQNIIALQTSPFQSYSAEVLSASYSALLVFAFL